MKLVNLKQLKNDYNFVQIEMRQLIVKQKNKKKKPLKQLKYCKLILQIVLPDFIAHGS